MPCLLTEQTCSSRLAGVDKTAGRAVTSANEDARCEHNENEVNQDTGDGPGYARAPSCIGPTVTNNTRTTRPENGDKAAHNAGGSKHEILWQI